MKTTTKLFSLLAIAAMTIACSSSEPAIEEPIGPEPPIGGEAKYPADTNPEKFDNFFKRTMVVDHTGTACGWCPFVVKALNDIEKTDDADKIVVVAAHSYNSSDPMNSPFATKYKNACGVTGYPTVNLDLRTTSNAKFGIEATAASIIKKCNSLEEKYPAKVAIAAAVTFDGTNFIVNTGVKVGVTGTYNIGVTVLESGIESKQINNGATGYNFNLHKHAVREGQPKSSVTGQALKDGTINAGEVINTDFTVPVPAKTNAANVSIVVYVACVDEGGSKMYINNAIVCKPGESVPFKYKE